MKKLLVLFLCSILISGDVAAANTRQHLFYISKSENKNQVHYAITLDEKCQPVGTTPVYAYWLMLEKGPNVYEGLLSEEQKVYGVGNQTVNKNIATFSLNSIPSKLITVESFSDNGICKSKTTTVLNGENSTLEYIYIDLWIFGVKKITAHGLKIKDGAKVEEEIK